MPWQLLAWFRGNGDAISLYGNYSHPECFNTAVLNAVQHAVTIAANQGQIFKSRHGHLGQSMKRSSVMNLDEPFTNLSIKTYEVEATAFTGKASHLPVHAFLLASGQLRAALNFPV